MPTSPRKTVLCRYHYDPLDRLADCTPYEQPGIQRFYCKNRLATEIQGAVRYSLFLHDDQLLAQQQRQDVKVYATLLATDQQRSVLNALHATRPHPLAYTPYGHRPLGNGLLSLLGFNGERPDPVTGHYHLGNGYRAFNPVLMRFNCPDSWSPFGEGGLNAYGYCSGDPRNRVDPTGHMFKTIKNPFKTSSKRAAQSTSTQNLISVTSNTTVSPIIERANGKPMQVVIGSDGRQRVNLNSLGADQQQPAPPLPPRKAPKLLSEPPARPISKPLPGLPKGSFRVSDQAWVKLPNHDEKMYGASFPFNAQTAKQLADEGVNVPLAYLAPTGSSSPLSLNRGQAQSNYGFESNEDNISRIRQ
jgi:RHS repeat-associated protein